MISICRVKTAENPSFAELSMDCYDIVYDVLDTYNTVD